MTRRADPLRRSAAIARAALERRTATSANRVSSILTTASLARPSWSARRPSCLWPGRAYNCDYPIASCARLSRGCRRVATVCLSSPQQAEGPRDGATIRGHGTEGSTSVRSQFTTDDDLLSQQGASETSGSTILAGGMRAITIATPTVVVFALTGCGSATTSSTQTNTRWRKGQRQRLSASGEQPALATPSTAGLERSDRRPARVYHFPFRGGLRSRPMRKFSLTEVVRAGRVAENVSEDGAVLRYRPDQQVLERPQSSRWPGRTRPVTGCSGWWKWSQMYRASCSSQTQKSRAASRLAGGSDCHSSPRPAGHTRRTATAGPAKTSPAGSAGRVPEAICPRKPVQVEVTVTVSGAEGRSRSYPRSATAPKRSSPSCGSMPGHCVHRQKVYRSS